MEKEKVTPKDLKVTLTHKGVISDDNQEKVIQRLQVNGCLIAMVSDVLESLMKDEEDLICYLDLRYKHDQKMHRSEMKRSIKSYHYHMTEFTKSFFGDASIRDNLEDNSQDLYDIIKLITDHTNDHKDMETIKRNLRKRKLNHHIFD